MRYQDLDVGKSSCTSADWCLLGLGYAWEKLDTGNQWVSLGFFMEASAAGLYYYFFHLNQDIFYLSIEGLHEL